jgi:hypothetical protein
MNYQEVIKKDADGNNYEIRVSVNSNMELAIDDVGFKAKGKRKWHYLIGLGSAITSNYSYRALDTKERREYRLNYLLEKVPNELLEEALNEVWEQMKPSQIKIR